MSLSPDLCPTSDPRYYRKHSSLHHLQYPNQTHWLTSASPIARAASFSRPYSPEKLSASSSDSDNLAMESFDLHQPDNGDRHFHDFVPQAQPIDSSPSHLHISALEHASTWDTASPYQISPTTCNNFNMMQLAPSFGSGYPGIASPASPYSTPSLYDESPLQSPYFSAAEVSYAGCHGLPPRSLPHDEDDYDEEFDPQEGKPYARLIFDALYQAPGNRMMLRDIYEWFEKNTNKPKESGTNGWQNSIRHNLSMNHAFENDKTQTTNARGEPKKASSVWFLTKHALQHGVQSTTRYRKTGGIRRSALNGRPDAMRAKSGAKGGRAARRAARLRQMEQSPHMSWTSPLTPDDLGDLRSFENLLRAANTMAEFPLTHGNTPPDTFSQYPYTSGLQESREDLPLHTGYKTKYESGEGAFDDYNSQDMLFSQDVDNTFDDAWFQASQRS